ncbi:unnamed protein product, partial [Pylaiella littoralis]
MHLAHSSRYWKTYRNSKKFTLTIYIYEAHLGVCNFNSSSGSFQSGLSTNAASMDNSASSSGGAPPPGAGAGDTKIVVSLPKDPTGERHETRRVGKTPNPVWDQAVVFRDIDYSELVRVEMRGIRKIGDNPVLASVEFEVHDVMGLSLRDEASVFQLECDRSRARYGVILLAFRFDPPVAADVLGELDGVDCATAVPRGVTATADLGEEEDAKAPAWGAEKEPNIRQPEAGLKVQEEPVYINVEGHFACLLLDDDGPVDACKPVSGRLSSASSSVSLVSATNGPDALPQRSRASLGAGSKVHPNHDRDHQHPYHHPSHPRLSTASHHSSKSDNSIFDPESWIHGRGSAVRMMAMAGRHTAGGRGAAGGGGRRSAAKEHRPRAASLSNNLAAQLSALGLIVGGGGGGGGGGGAKANAGKLGKSVDSGRKSSCPDPDDGLDLGATAPPPETPPQLRWVMPRRRPKRHETAGPGASAAGEGDGRSYSERGGGSGKRARAREVWAHGFLRSPALGGLRSRAGVGGVGGSAASGGSASSGGGGGGSGAGGNLRSGPVGSSFTGTVRAGEDSRVAE